MKHNNNIYTDLFNSYQGVDVKDVALKFQLVLYMSFDNEIINNIKIIPVLEKKHRKFDIIVTSHKNNTYVKTFRTSFLQLKNYLNSLFMNGVITSAYYPFYSFDILKIITPILHSKINNVDKMKVKMGLHILAAFDTYYHQGITLNILKSLIPTLRKYLIIKYKNTTVTVPWNFLIQHLDSNIVSPKIKDSFPFDFVLLPSWT